MANVPMAAAEGGDRNSFQFPAEVGSESEPQKPQFQFQFPKVSYVDELGSLSSAIRTFQCRFHELQDHLLSIHNAIVSSSNSHHQTLSVTDTKIANSSAAVVNAENGGHPLPHPHPHPHPVSSPSPRSNDPETCAKESTEKQSESSELEHLCQTMCSRGLRKYIVSNLSDLAKLRHEVPVALKCAPNPAKLVFDCIGRFYLQGSKAYTKDSPMIPARQASILILELFLLSGAAENTQIEPSLKVEADLAAIAWRKRLVSETGSCQASDIDARGLLLFLASFGIPTVFTNDDLRDLLRSSNSKGISNALRRSRALFTCIPGM